jgi:hypothetical protein
MAVPLGMGLEIVSDHRLTRKRSGLLPKSAPSSKELDAIELPTYGLTGANDNPHEELERSRPSTLHDAEGATIVPSFSHPPMNRWRLLSACGEYFANGLNDSSPGTLIPYIEKWYHIGYAVISTIWIANAAGM